MFILNICDLYSQVSKGTWSYNTLVEDFPQVNPLHSSKAEPADVLGNGITMFLLGASFFCLLDTAYHSDLKLKQTRD